MDARKRSEWTARLGSLGVTMLAAFGTAVLLLLAFSSSFKDALSLFFLGPFKNLYYFGNMLNASIPLVLTGLAASIAFTSRNFNLGGEGQVYLGAIATAAVCLAMPEGNPVLVPMLGALAGMAAGGIIGWMSGFLKRRLAVDELISSFLVSSAIVFVGDFLITGPLQDPASNFQTTSAISPSFRFARILLPSSLSLGCLVAVAALLATWFMLSKTRFGFELKLTGKNGEFSRYCGIDTGLYASAPMTLSGALNGLAGAALILGTYYKAMKGFSSGIGWSGIAVALIASNNPIAVLPAALFFAYLDAGAKAVMVGADVTSEIVSVVQAVVFFLVTARALDGLFIGRGKRKMPGAAK